MDSNKLRELLIQEMDIGTLSKEAQADILSKVGETVLATLTTTIFEKLSENARNEFEKISVTGDHTLIQEFLDTNVPDLSTLVKEAIKKALNAYKEQMVRQILKGDSSEGEAHT